MIRRFKELSLPIRLLLSLGSIILAVSLIFLSLLYLEYWIAIYDASDPNEDETSENLTAVSEDGVLMWEGGPADRGLLVVTWASENESFYEGHKVKSLKPGDSFETDKEIWVTVVPELKNACRKVQPECRDSVLRLRQLLGLPPHDQKTRFVELWASPSDLFRPCPDPEITDTVCNLEPPVNTPDHPNHIDWFDPKEKESYGPLGYPWTRLGYTYDWGNPQSEFGPSEFVIENGANVEVKTVAMTNEYLQ